MPRKDKPSIIKQINEANIADLPGFIEELQQGPDRTTAILAGVFIDELLRMLLESFLVADAKVQKELFSPERPLSTLSARTKMAYSLGLISKVAYDDIEIIRNIRNAFAHSLHGISFEHELVRKEVRSLHCIQQFQPPADAPSRYFYIIATVILLSYIVRKVNETLPTRREAPEDDLLMIFHSKVDVDSIEWKDLRIIIKEPE